jgi:hypothetical protein
MAENKTRATDASVQAFLEGVVDERKREDSFTLVQLMQDITGEPAVMWGDAIVGFGSCHYKYDSGREGDMPLVGFSPRKQNLALYILSGYRDEEALLNKLGKHKTGKSCLYVNALKDADMDVLRQMVERSVKHTRDTYPG